MRLRQIPLGLSLCAAVVLVLFSHIETASAITPLPSAVLNSNAASDSGDDNVPSVATDGAGNWVAVWSSVEDLGGTLGTDMDILVSRSTDNGATWTAPAALHSHFTADTGGDQLYGPLATDGAGNWLVVWASSDDLDDLGWDLGPDADILGSRSTDNGATWSAPAPVNSDADSDRTDALGHDGHALKMAMSSGGTAIVTWYAYKMGGGENDLFFARSTDGGLTWSALAPLNTNAATDTGEDYGSAPLATDGAGNWVVVWGSNEDLETTGYNDWDGLVARSSDDGVTWTDPEYLHDYFKTDPVSDEFRGWVATDGAGNWVTTWMSSDSLVLTIGTDLDLLMSRSTDNGASWTYPVPLNADAATDGFQHEWGPRMLADGDGNWVTVWRSNNYTGEPIGADSDVLVARSTDDGVSWTYPTPLHTNAYSDSGSDDNPFSATDGNGNWVAIWQSNENLGGTLGTDLDIFSAAFALRTVDSTADDGDFSTADGTCDIDDSAGDGPCTLRAAIEQANADPNLDNIGFDIDAATDPGCNAGTGVCTIQPTSALPWITQPVSIDGYTQDGASANTNPPNSGSNAVLKIELDGTNAGPNTNGLQLTAGGSTINGLAINRFSQRGVDVQINGGNTIEGCFIGTDPTGTVDQGNSGAGVSINGVPGNTVGGTTPAARNVISGDDNTGVYILYSGATGNLVQGNLIGTNAAGTAALGNSYGVRIHEAPGNTLGGTTPAARNVISGSDNSGVLVNGTGATGNLVQGNYIGTDVTGTADLGNSGTGVSIFNAPGNTLGGTTPGAGNVVSGNDNGGVSILLIGATGNLVQGNYIGTDAAGTADLGNFGIGVSITSASTNTIGGTTPAARNVVAGNSTDGVRISGTGATGNLVQGNYIGTNAAGDLGIPNDWAGVMITADASENTLGGTAPGESNTIAFNTQSGVCVGVDTSTGNSIRGNSIHSNTLLGIDLVPDGENCASGLVTANDTGDPDTGPNDLMNYPVIIYAYYDGANTTVSGTLDTVDPDTSTVDVYTSATSDGSGYGEGQVYLGSAMATGGNWELVFSGAAPYTYIYATATDGAGNTSEFSSAPMDDTDSDGIPDDYETGTGVYVSPTDTGTNPALADSDGDGVCDGAGVVSGTCDTAGPDNCPFVGNEGQTNSDGLPAGDACQCGDLDEDGVIDAADVTIARQHLVGATIDAPAYELTRCNVIGPSDGGVSDCDVADIFVLERVVAGRPATVENTCEASRAP